MRNMIKPWDTVITCSVCGAEIAEGSPEMWRWHLDGDINDPVAISNPIGWTCPRCWNEEEEDIDSGDSTFWIFPEGAESPVGLDREGIIRYFREKRASSRCWNESMEQE